MSDSASNSGSRFSEAHSARSGLKKRSNQCLCLSVLCHCQCLCRCSLSLSLSLSLSQVYASAINRADTLQRKGLYPPPPGASAVLGLEAAGIIEAIGNDCELAFKVGDKVMSLLDGGGNADFVVTDERLLMPVPAAYAAGWELAAATPETWLTAFQLLHLLAEVTDGDTVLVHAGGSGVGTAATQLAVAAGATVIVTAGSQEKLDVAARLGASVGINYKTDDFSEKVLEATAGKGVSVILDCVGGSHWEKNLASIAVDGRWVLYGLMGGKEAVGPALGGILRKRIRLMGTTLRSRSIAYKVGRRRESTRDSGGGAGGGGF